MGNENMISIVHAPEHLKKLLKLQINIELNIGGGSLSQAALTAALIARGYKLPDIDLAVNEMISNGKLASTPSAGGGVVVP